MAKNLHKDNEKENSDDIIRLDKWLWAARFYKTRSIAKEMIDGGKVHYNGQRTKPNKAVEVGAKIKLRQGNEEKEVEVTALSTQRRGAPQAQLLYAETAMSVENREKMALARKMNAMPHPDHRPNKKERRDLIKFKNQN
ncbi:ribosome-associated heat shock protein Hsp15 [Mannheimia massilioguelmaensis]|uniref:ribosome-associated heat shock protein Hsp15 n=1 Tax=Mannheimia massilioguelmaensis TaxID=1604354 RepID=UPI0005C9F5CD|nr:ribosome-associated heat shock protein Hsp15 [Mannheimia massilioguelmaensis]